MEKRVLIERWLGSETQGFPIYDAASVSAVRQRVRDAGAEAGLGKHLVESVALMASELAHNQLAHSRRGYVGVRFIERSGSRGLELVAADIGPGIDSPSLAIANKVPTGQSLGAGLGAVYRIADEVEFDNRIVEGLCITARKFDTPAKPLCCDVAIMGRPFPGEGISGDDGILLQSESSFLAAVSDGLGHGPEARYASNGAVQTVIQERGLDLEGCLFAIDRALAGARGCAMSIARYDKETGILECASLGDVHAHLYTLRDAHLFASTPAILGTGQLKERKIRIERQPVQPGAVLVLFTDGLKSGAHLKGRLDVLRQPPIAIAERLIAEYARPDDDVLVMVARFLR